MLENGFLVIGKVGATTVTVAVAVNYVNKIPYYRFFNCLLHPAIAMMSIMYMMGLGPLMKCKKCVAFEIRLTYI